MSEEINRRDFIRRAGMTTASVSMAAAGLVASRNVLGANDRVRAGVIGAGQQGRDDFLDFMRQPEGEVVALCDVYQPSLDKALAVWQDELIKQKVPVYCNGFSRGIIPGRVVLDSYQQPVQCGGVYVQPGDLVVADGDGVIVIPQDRIEEAFGIAKKIQVNDQKSRAQLYKRLGIPADFTLGQSAKEAD